MTETNKLLIDYIIQNFMNESFTPKKQEQAINKNIQNIKISPVKAPNGAKQIGNYILGKTIGSGTFGKVHLGLHTPTGQKVAVKIIDKTKLNSKDRQRVCREKQILKKLMHPSLIQLYEIIETQKSLLLITQYMPNGQLFNYIIQKKKLTQEQACKIFHQIIQGLQYMHSIGIAHRDLKPQNILIDFDGSIKIIDFGLGKTYKKDQKLKTECGSPCYAAPEMIQGKSKYQPIFIDIWSIGIVLFAMIAGYLPFCDPDISKLYKKILSGSFIFPNWISNQARDLIEKMLVVNPYKRLSIDQIKQHAWYRKVAVRQYSGIDTKLFKVPYEQSIINNIQDMVFKMPHLAEDLQLNLKSKQTALYYIIVKKMIKQGHIIETYFGCKQFKKQYLQLLNSKQISQEIDSSTYVVDIQAVSVQQDTMASPKTNSAIYNQSQFQNIIQDFMNSKTQTDDLKTIQRKNKFYANNLQNQKKRLCLRIQEPQNENKFFYDKPEKKKAILSINHRMQSVRTQIYKTYCNSSKLKVRGLSSMIRVEKKQNKELKNKQKTFQIKYVRRKIDSGDTTTSGNSRQNKSKQQFFKKLSPIQVKPAVKELITL